MFWLTFRSKGSPYYIPIPPFSPSSSRLCARHVILGFFSVLWHFSCAFLMFFFFVSVDRRFSLPLWQLPQFYFEL